MDKTRHLYLVRHGEAKSKDEDPQRGLTTAGADAVQKVANWAANAGVRVDEIRHSEKLRAEQTAKIIAAALQPSVEPHTTSGLNPNDDVVPVARSMDGEERTVMLVGHLPFLGRLVSQLVVGDPDQAIVTFDAASLVRLCNIEDRWVVDCVLAPDLLA